MAPAVPTPGSDEPARAAAEPAGAVAPDVVRSGQDPVAARAEVAIESAAPPVGARVLAFVAIVVGGTCGGLIGYAIADLQCTGDCETVKGLGATGGALVAAIGVAVVAVLVLRAMGEWRTIQHRSPTPRR